MLCNTENTILRVCCMHAYCGTGISTGRCLLCNTSSSCSWTCCAVSNWDSAQTKVCRDCRLVRSEDRVIILNTVSLTKLLLTLVLANVATIITDVSGRCMLQVIWQLPMEPSHCWTTSPAWTPQRWPRPKPTAPSSWLTATWLSGLSPMPSPLAQVDAKCPCFA